MKPANWVSCFSSTVSTTAQLCPKTSLILHPGELKPDRRTHPSCPRTREPSKMCSQAAHMNTHLQQRKTYKWGFGLVGFYNTRFFGVQVWCFFPLQVRHKYMHPSVVWGFFVCWFSTVGHTKLLHTHKGTLPFSQLTDFFSLQQNEVKPIRCTTEKFYGFSPSLCE